jgi:hypothetical protein
VNKALHRVKYTDRREPRSRPAHLSLVTASASQAVGDEAKAVETLLKRLGETFEQIHLFSRDRDDLGALEYRSITPKQLGTVMVRYRDLGQLLPREIHLEDE